MRSGRFSDTISVCFLIFCWVQQITNVDFDIDRTIRQYRSNGSFPDRERQASATEEIQNPKPHTASQPHLGTSSVGTRSGGKRLLSLGKTSFSQLPSSSSQKDAAKQASAVEMRVLSQDEQSRERALRSMRKSLDRMCFPGFVGAVKLCLLLVGSAGTEVSPFPTPTLSPQAEWWRSQLGQPGFGEWKRACRGGQRKGQKQSSCCAFTYTNATSCEQAADCHAQDIRNSFRSCFQRGAEASDSPGGTPIGQRGCPSTLARNARSIQRKPCSRCRQSLASDGSTPNRGENCFAEVAKRQTGLLGCLGGLCSLSERAFFDAAWRDGRHHDAVCSCGGSLANPVARVDESTCPLNRRGSRDQNHGRDGRGRSHGCSGSGRSQPKASATGEGRAATVRAQGGFGQSPRRSRARPRTHTQEAAEAGESSSHRSGGAPWSGQRMSPRGFRWPKNPAFGLTVVAEEDYVSTWFAAWIAQVLRLQVVLDGFGFHSSSVDPRTGWETDSSIGASFECTSTFRWVDKREFPAHVHPGLSEYDGACNKSLQLKRVHSAWQTEPQSILGPPTCVSSFKGLGKCVSFPDEGEEALQARRSKIRRIRSARTAAQPLSVLPAIGGGSLSSFTAEGGVCEVDPAFPAPSSSPKRHGRSISDGTQVPFCNLSENSGEVSKVILLDAMLNAPQESTQELWARLVSDVAALHVPWLHLWDPDISSLELPVWLTTYVRDHSTWHNEHVVGAACAPVAFHLFTDGSAEGEAAGWGAAAFGERLGVEHASFQFLGWACGPTTPRIFSSDWACPTTNNAAECHGLLVMLGFVCSLPPWVPVFLYTDSMLTMNVATGVCACADGPLGRIHHALRSFCQFFEQSGRMVSWHHVSSHVGIRGNEIADRAADKGRLGFVDRMPKTEQDCR